MYYLICAVSLIIFSGITVLIHFFFPAKKKLIVERILPCLLMAIFVVRVMCYQTTMTHENLIGYVNNPNKPMNNFLGISGLFSYWFNITCLVALLIRPFFSFKFLKNFVKYICLPVFIINAACLYQTLHLMYLWSENVLLYYILPIEIGLSIALSIYYFIEDFKVKITLKEIGILVGVFLLMNLASMPPYAPQILFGYVNPLIKISGLSFEHRIFLYLFLIIIPFSLYFGLRNKHEDIIRFALIFISVATLICFMTYYKYDRILRPWTWPIHLCNTAMFLMPICFIFKTKRLFYFTYFINVLGALIAMLVPNYPSSANAMSSVLIHFWFNHAIAFGLPILGVALKVFERPKKKLVWYSLIGFFGYFVLAMILNVVFTGIGHETDFFFLNSNYVPEKLGIWAEDIYRISASFRLGGVNLVFHPLYQFLFFVVYVGVVAVIWFVYEIFFSIADSHYELATRLKEIKVDRIALLSQLNGRSLDEPMDKEAGISYKLINFSKRYGASKVYAVNDANLEVHGGEIFGFLGPNGAGKSTIIKCTVGIQSIKEGSIEICGFDCKKQPVQSKSLIGFVPDHYALYERLSGREYLNYIADIYEVSKEDREERLNKYVALFQLEGAIDNKIKTYSHGMKQKITIMSALIHNPKVWILDEPLTGLDPTSIYQVKECMKAHAKEGNIVFFSSHIIDIVEKLCDRVAIIKKGEIQCVKSVDEIESNGSTLEQFYLNTIGETLEER